ncbi:hypothetical protein IMCC1989_21 [gamma proteobacterium IMCC1989]|nr:hypothetical protein IMCC1989_21 [gamma proteobacterium IMCC1989]
MHINNGTPTLSSTSVNTQSQLLSDQKGLEGNTLASAETAVPANKPEDSSIQYRQSSAYLLSIGTQDQQTSLTYSAKSQYSISNNHSSYTSSSSSTTSITASSAVNEPPALLDGARNILSFIEQRIASEQAAGASLETLDTLLQQGLAGFTQGYDEARAILGDQDSLNDAVDDSISLLYQQVVDGINDLRHSYLGEAKMEPTAVAQQATATPVDASAQQSAPATSKHPPSLNSSLTSPINNLMDELSGSPDAKILTLLDSLEKIDEVREYAAEYAETKEFSFNLTTADGDTVTINASRASSVSAYNNTDGNQGLSITQGNQQQQFSFAIDGELDDGEMEAINDLMQQVMSLSEQFYNGDIGEAYEAALAMDYDSTEITSYALQLKQTESYEVAAIYDEVAPSTFSPAADLHSVFETIGDYTQQVLKGILDSGNHQQNHYAQMIEAVARQLDHQLDQQLNKETGTDLYQFSDSVATMMELV